MILIKSKKIKARSDHMCYHCGPSDDINLNIKAGEIYKKDFYKISRTDMYIDITCARCVKKFKEMKTEYKKYIQQGHSEECAEWYLSAKMGVFVKDKKKLCTS